MLHGQRARRATAGPQIRDPPATPDESLKPQFDPNSRQMPEKDTHMQLPDLAKISAGLAITCVIAIVGIIVFLGTMSPRAPVRTYSDLPAPATVPLTRPDATMSERDRDDFRRLDRLEINQQAATRSNGAKR